MVTGDNDITARYVANALGIGEVYSEVLPAEKGDIIKRLQNERRVVAMASMMRPLLLRLTLE